MSSHGPGELFPQGNGRYFCNGDCQWNDAEGCTKMAAQWKGGGYLNPCGQ